MRLKLHFDMRRVLFSQLKVGETYYEYYTDSRDKFVGFDGYSAIFKQHIFFAYKKCQFYELVPFKEIVRINRMNEIASLIPHSNIIERVPVIDYESDLDLAHLGNDALFFK
jgi:hypothetical protein